MRKQKEEKPKVHVPLEFRLWWNPLGTDTKTGASVGGHPDAYRLWARPEPNGSYTRHHYGIDENRAWMTPQYREEFYEWNRFGSPRPLEPFVSLAATLAEQKKFWQGVKGLITGIAKPVEEAISFESNEPY